MVFFTLMKKNSRIMVTTIENEFVVIYLPLDACPCGCFSAALRPERPPAVTAARCA
jgi:hypothetical protein